MSQKAALFLKEAPEGRGCDFRGLGEAWVDLWPMAGPCRDPVGLGWPWEGGCL